MPSGPGSVVVFVTEVPLSRNWDWFTVILWDSTCEIVIVGICITSLDGAALPLRLTVTPLLCAAW